MEDMLSKKMQRTEFHKTNLEYAIIDRTVTETMRCLEVSIMQICVQLL